MPNNNRTTYIEFKNGLQRREYLYNTLKSRGYSDLHTSAIIGNLMQESYFDLKPNARVKSTGAFGLAQWMDNKKGAGRLTDLKNFSKNKNKDYRQFETQVDFLLHELEGTQNSWKKSDLEDFLNTDDLEKATFLFANKFERMGESEAKHKKRVNYAKRVYQGNPFKTAENKNITFNDTNPVFYDYGKYLISKGFDPVVTSADDNDLRANPDSEHYNPDSLHIVGNALDFRFDEKLHKFIENDPYAKQLGLYTIDPNHGSAKHTHLSYRGNKENPNYNTPQNVIPKRDNTQVHLHQTLTPQQLQNLTQQELNNYQQQINNQNQDNETMIYGEEVPYNLENTRLYREPENNTKEQVTTSQEDVNEQINKSNFLKTFFSSMWKTIEPN